MGVRMASEPRLGLVDGDIVPGRQDVGCGQPGDTGTDDGDRFPILHVRRHRRYSD